MSGPYVPTSEHPHHWYHGFSWIQRDAHTDFLADGHFLRHLRHMKSLYRERRDAMVDAIGDEGWAHTGPQVIVDCTPLPLKARAPPPASRR